MHERKKRENDKISCRKYERKKVIKKNNYTRSNEVKEKKKTIKEKTRYEWSKQNKDGEVNLEQEVNKTNEKNETCWKTKENTQERKK